MESVDHHANTKPRYRATSDSFIETSKGIFSAQDAATESNHESITSADLGSSFWWANPLAWAATLLSPTHGDEHSISSQATTAVATSCEGSPTMRRAPLSSIDLRRGGSLDEALEITGSADRSTVDLSRSPSRSGAEFRSIRGTGTSKDADGKCFTVYFIEVYAPDPCTGATQSWTVYRRYRQFQAELEDLKRAGVQCPPLPPRKFLGAMDRDFVHQRRTELEAWLRKTADAVAQGSVRASDVFQSFLSAHADEIPLTMELHSPARARKASTAMSKANTPCRTPLIQETLNGKPQLCPSDFEQVRVLGKGSFGKVTLVKRKGHEGYHAMKVLSKAHLMRSKQVEHTCTERRVLGKVKHPFIVDLHYAFQTEAKLYYVLEFCPGGELFFHLSRMKKLPEYMARFYTAEITLALEHLHKLGIVFRDLTSQNILLDNEGHVKLADFGLAKENVTSATSGATSLCGTPEYIAPEVLLNKGHGTAVDWWNLGMVLYEMLTGLPPWYTTDRKKLFTRLRRSQLAFPRYVSAPAAELITGLLNRNPAQRLGALGGTRVMKAHRFFNTIDWAYLLAGKVKPPFNPCKKDDPANVRNFDQQFTAMPVDPCDLPDTTKLLARAALALQREPALVVGSRIRDAFADFNYDPDSC